MKSYTDISQSKKLAQILPLESADMWWAWYSSPLSNGHYGDFPMFCKPVCNPDESVPCWSLASLLNVLPNNKHLSTTLSRGGWRIEPPEYVDKWWCEYEDDNCTKDFSVSADNPVDACVAMIKKLHELKML